MPTNHCASETKAFAELLRTVRTLRKLCPWDRQQTVASTRPLLINEVYELDEAIRRKSREATIDELGDYLFVGLFLATVLEQKRGVRLADVLRRATTKLRKRHPHVYGSRSVQNADEVLANWERLKDRGRRRSILAGLPAALPALQQAQLIQERCHRVGFDWNNPSEVLQKVQEEFTELTLALRASVVHRRKARGRTGHPGANETQSSLYEELGDLLFAIVNLCRHLKIDAEGALKDANRKFQRRFERVE
ncbi:MAG: nucleoside triphosphate pyrophosphohydrolase, partial [candidate division WOR-3 bacterium]